VLGAKYLMNRVFSVALIAVSIVCRETFSKYDPFLYYYGTVMITYVLFGSTFSIVIAFWGYYSSCKKRPSRLFNVALSLNLISHITISIIYISFLEETLTETVETQFEEQILTYTKNPQALDYAQISLNCCGKYQASDWFQYLPHIPASCCPHNNETIACTIGDFFTMNHNGCIKELETITEPNVEVILVLFLGLQISEILTLVMSSWSYWHTMINEHNNSAAEKKTAARVSQIPEIYQTHL
ncbi:CD63 antigen, partial [Gryllus bimaculatus]